MSMSSAEYDAVFGTAWHVNGDTIKERLVYTTYAGDPTGNLVPKFIGQECFDTTNAAFYQATSLLAAGWKKLTP